MAAHRSNAEPAARLHGAGDVGLDGARSPRRVLLPARRSAAELRRPGGNRRGLLRHLVGLVETEEVSEESWTARFPWEKLKADFAGWHPDIQTLVELAHRTAC